MSVYNCVGCEHMKITLIGSEETGCRLIVCRQCGYSLTRRRDKDGDFVYYRGPDSERVLEHVEK
jgi:DNA-directed RNA polymerase subunit RPC12/RpoP